MLERDMSSVDLYEVVMLLVKNRNIVAAVSMCI